MSQEKTKNRKRCICQRCGWDWFPRNQDSEPATCTNPQCRSPYWNKPRAYKLEGKPEPTRKRVSIEKKDVTASDTK